MTTPADTTEPAPAFWPAGKRAAVSLSFDDGRPSQVDHGLDVLARHNVRATFYVMPGAIAQRIDGWRRAVAAGHEIGNHSNTHPCSGNFPFARPNALEGYTPARIGQDIDAAQQAIHDALGVMPETFAYPCGHTFVGRGPTFASYVPLVARKFLAGRRAFDETHNHPSACDLSHCFGMDFDGASFEKVRALIDRAIDDNSWLILVGHDVGFGKVQTVHPDVLDAVCRYCATDRAADVWIDTVAAVARHVRGNA